MNNPKSADGNIWSDDQMMANLLREGQNCMKNRLIFGFNAHMIAANENPDR